MTCRFMAVVLSSMLLLAGAARVVNAQAGVEPLADRIQIPAQAQPILPLADVAVGMKGYGLSVFHGTTIEPFAVEVISVQSHFEPKRGVIWIRCPDERLTLSGPVQGMSGSPIYLWADGEEQELGRGGRLIGAFAYGFPLSKQCIAGVQPIEQMRDVGERAEPGRAAAQARGTSVARASLAALRDVAMRADLPTWRLELIDRLLAGPGHSGDVTRPTVTPPAKLGATTARLEPMLLPLTVGDAKQAAILAPILAPMGLAPVASPLARVAGPAPRGFDTQDVRLRPGSMLSIPLGFGDADLSAAGTVTDVLPDGRVLAFGHAMFGQGDLALPMATAYVHSVIPMLTASFKLSGSLDLAGALVRDENSAVVGVRDGAFTVAPLRVNVAFDGQPPRQYSYQVVHHPMFTPIIIAILTNASVTATQQLPIEHTIRVKGALTFSGDRRLRIDSSGAGHGVEALVMAILPPTVAMLQNPFDDVELTGGELDVSVEPTMRVMTLVDARLRENEVAPGQSVQVAVRLQPYGQPIRTQHLSLKVPENMPDGDYDLVVADGGVYANLVLGGRPHRLMVRSLDELHEALQQMLDVDASSLYLMLQLPEPGLAYGRQELPRLPSSRRALVQTPTTTAASDYAQWLEARHPMDAVTMGQLSFKLTVRRPYAVR